MKKQILFFLFLLIFSVSLQSCGSDNPNRIKEPVDPATSTSTVLSKKSLGDLKDLGDYVKSTEENWFFASTIDVNSKGQIIGESSGNRLIFWDPADPNKMSGIPRLANSASNDSYEVLKINDKGRVIGNIYGDGGSSRGFIWDSSPDADPLSVDLDAVLSLKNTVVVDINKENEIILTADTDKGRRAYFWNGQQDSSAILLFGILGSTSSESVSLNDRRQVVILSQEQGVYYDLTIGESNGYGMATLNTFPGVESSTPVAINNNKRIAGTSGDEGFFWTGGVMYPISNPFGSPVEIVGINNEDIVVGNSGGQAFIWKLNSQRKGEYKNLGTLGGTSSTVVGINDRGEIIGYSTTGARYMEGNVSADVVHGFLWKDEVMYDLGAHAPPNYEYPFDSNFYSSMATAISESGIVTGISYSINNHARGFTLTPVFPE